MPSINVAASDFEILAAAAYAAHRRGCFSHAAALDKLARKVNAALSSAAIRDPFGIRPRSLTWKEVPSTLEGLISIAVPTPESAVKP